MWRFEPSESARNQLPTWQGRQLHTVTVTTRFPGQAGENGDGIEFQSGDDLCSGPELTWIP
jgi:hypothetical protein